MIPTEEECFQILQERAVPDHIIRHSIMVHRAAVFLAQALNRQGEKLDPTLIGAGSLLHDIAKMDGLRSRNSHSRDGAHLLIHLGYAEVAEIVRQHVVLDPPHGDPNGRFDLTEAAVVHYADKRVKHTEIVSLRERFHDLKERYGKAPEALAWMESAEEQGMRLEKRIFEKLSFGPEKLNSLSQKS